MGAIKEPQSVFFFSSIIFSKKSDLEAVLSAFANEGMISAEQTPLIPFDQTTYYAKEMGNNLMRVFVLFEGLAKREKLPDLKLKTNDMESVFSYEDHRTVNIDPGYVALEHVILATSKGYAHRVYLGKGIHSDLTLIYRNGTYAPLEWTYPDYREPENIALFQGWREKLRKVLKCQKA